MPPIAPPKARGRPASRSTIAGATIPRDNHLKSSRALVHTLCEVAGKGGNLLLNVSPMGDGALPPEQIERLEEIARLDGAQRREYHRHPARAGAVAVLWTARPAATIASTCTC